MELALSGLTLLYVNIRRFDYAEFVNGAMKVFIKAFVFMVSCAVTPFLKLAAFRKINRCPAISNKLLFIHANELARRIRRKEITSEEIVRAYIERCLEVNPVLNAIVENRFEAAIKEAREVDLLLKSGTRSEELLARDTPLLGIPVTVKESIAVEVQRVRRAGGIIILVSNTPEMCMCWETYNNVTGTTLNPYDTRRTSGGSSGGEVNIKDINFYYFEEIPSFLTHKINSEIITGIHKFIQHLESSQGIKTHKAVIPDLKYAFEASSTMLLKLEGVDTVFDEETNAPLKWKSVLGEILRVCNVTYMMIFNAIGLPVTQCPIGFNKNGLPIGFQVVGNVGQDHLTIAVAREVERIFGGWKPPPSC
ncbi:hypothetical protein G9C98_004289 [Cotesia typhae]|uniref:Amidase domain-containing protein n=1 Tax=Cotesia typhae TaxID=2053667 RepID=A0A8J5QYL1_9HYME|nr:hypothetical protein G9C98_004289 [Cotesia typhae]